VSLREHHFQVEDQRVSPLVDFQHPRTFEVDLGECLEHLVVRPHTLVTRHIVIMAD
jgi:hypothetical protein